MGVGVCTTSSAVPPSGREPAHGLVAEPGVRRAVVEAANVRPAGYVGNGGAARREGSVQKPAPVVGNSPGGAGNGLLDGTVLRGGERGTVDVVVGRVVPEPVLA